MRLFVTGLSGFVGNWLLEMVATDPRWHNITVLPASDVDLLDRPALCHLMAEQQPDAVVHLAAWSSVATAIKDPIPTANVNVIGTLNLLDALESNGFTGRLLFVGSSEEYGHVEPAQLPVAETAPLAPCNPYAASKVAAEMFVLERVRRGRLDAVCVRPFNHTGPRQDQRFVVSALAGQVSEITLGSRPPEIVAGDLDITRDFLDVRDVVAAYLLLLQRGTSGGIYNVCSGHETRLADLLAEMQRLAGVSVPLVRDPARLRPTEQRRSCGDNARLRALGWSPAIPMTETLQAMLSWWRANLEKETP